MEFESKEGLIDAFRAFLKEGEYSPEKEAKAKQFREAYKVLNEAEILKQKESYLEEGGDEADFEPRNDEFDGKFKEIYNLFLLQKKEFNDAKAAAEKKNLQEKKKLLEELQHLTQEENIGRAFSKFNAIKANWDEIGQIPSNFYKDIQDEYSRLIDLFYYQIKIFKELQENDLKKNFELKKDLIERMKILSKESSIKEIEVMVKAFEAEWNQIGPTFQEKWEEVRDEFGKVTSEVYERIRNHYQEIKDKQKDNLAKKNELITALTTLMQEELVKPKDWENASEKINQLQEEWRKIGRVAKDKSDAVWKNFRSLIDVFYEKKKEFYAEIKEEYTGHKDQKKALIEAAEALKESELWKQSSEKIIQLQKDWKKIGYAGAKDDQKLWNQFQKACNHFFDRKKAYYGNLDGILEENQKQKEVLLEQIKNFEIGDDKAKNIEQLKAFAHQWNLIGQLPRAVREDINNAYKKLLDEKYDALKLKKSEKLKLEFENKLDKISEAENASEQLKFELRNLSDQIRKLAAEVQQYENNLGFFKYTDDKNPMKMEVVNKIAASKERLTALELKKKMLNKAIKESAA